MLWALLLVSAALGWGRVLIPRSGEGRPPDGLGLADCLGLAAGMGFLFLSLTGSLCLLLGWVSWGFPLLVLSGSLMSLRFLASLPRPAAPGFAGSLVLAWLATALLTSLAPVTDWDTLVYHFVLPRDAVEAGRSVFRRDIPHAALPQGAESLWALAMFGGGERAALLLQVAVLAAVLGAAGWAARALWGADGAWARVGALGSLSMLQAAGGGAVEPLLGLALLLAVSLGALALRGEGGRPAWTAAALAGGAALGIKATALCFLPCFALVALVAGRGRRAPLLAACLASGVLGCPWYLRSWFETGNPFYPYPCPLWPDLPKEIAISAGPLLFRDPQEWLSRLGQALLCEPGVFLGIGTALMGSWRGPRSWGTALAAGAAVLLLCMRYEGGRYLSAVLPLAAVACAGAAGPRVPLAVLALAFLALGGARAWARIPALFGAAGREAFLDARVEVSPAARFCLGLNAEPGSIALAGDRGLPFPPGTLLFPDYAQNVLNPYSLKSPAELHAALRALGVRILALDRSRRGRGLQVASFLPSAPAPAPAGFLLLYEDPGASVYRLVD